MEPLFRIGEIEIYLFSVTVFFGVIVGVYFFLKEAKKHNVSGKALLLPICLSFVGALIGGRLFYFILNLNDYISDFALFYQIQSGFSIHGGIITGIAVAIVVLHKKKLPVWETLDIAAPFLALAHGISMIGNQTLGLQISSDALWTIRIDGFFYHPIQAYEFLLSFLLFGYLLLRLRSKEYQGQVILNYIVGLFFIIGVVEFAKEYSAVLGPLNVGQLISLVGIVVTLLFSRRQKRNNRITKPTYVAKYDIAKTWGLLWVLMLGSVVVYYVLQG